jgi:hypothetical protein
VLLLYCTVLGCVVLCCSCSVISLALCASACLSVQEEEEETVPKSKVLEMESLFMEAINRLSERVIQLEQSKSSGGGGSGSRGKSGGDGEGGENDWLNDDSDFGQGATAGAGKAFIGAGSNSAPNKHYSIRGNAAAGPRAPTNAAPSYGSSLKSASRKMPSSLGASSSASALSASGGGAGNSRIEPGRIRVPNKLNI